MTLNVLCEIAITRPAAKTLRGAYAESVVSGTYYGDFSIASVQRLEWILRRPPETLYADCALVIDNANNQFIETLGDSVWGGAQLTVRVGRGSSLTEGYGKVEDGTSPGMLWQGSLLFEHGVEVLPSGRVLLRASSDLFANDSGVFENTSNAQLDDADSFSRWVPLVFGNWQDGAALLPIQTIPAIRTGYGGSQGDGGDWTVCLGPVESLGSYFKEGSDPTARDNAHRNDRFEITSWVTGANRGTTAPLEARFSLAGRAGTGQTLLGYTPEGVWVKMKGLQTTATRGVPGLAANTFIDRARDQALWFVLHSLNIPQASIDTGSLLDLPTFSGRRYIINQQPARNLIEELEHDLAFRFVWLSGDRGVGHEGQALVAQLLGQGSIKSDWSAARYLVERDAIGRPRELGYENLDYALYNFSASFGVAGAKGANLAFDQAEIIKVGAGAAADFLLPLAVYGRRRGYAAGRLFVHYGDWPWSPCSFL